MLINVIVNKYATESLVSLLQVEIYDIQVSISNFDQILGKTDSQTRQVFNFADIWFRDFVVLKLYVGTKFRKNGQKSRNSQNLISSR